jgi:hypothetical protein
MTPQTGKAGTQVTLSIVYSYPQTQGNYKVLWSQTQLFSSTDTQILKEGVITNGATSINTQITIPESRYGNHYIRFRPDNGSNYVNFQFNVLPNLQVKPSSVVSGSVVTISGNGFPANDITTFKISSQLLDKYFSTTENGNFTGQLSIPALPAGKYELTAMTQLVALSSSVTMEILPAPIKSEDKHPEITDSKNNVPAYGNANVNTPTGPGQKTTPVPTSEPIIISAPAAKSTTAVTEWIGIIGPQQVTIQWAQASGETDVTYTIEISENNDFSPGRLIRESGLTNTSYTTILEPGIYYWRVKAINHKGNESYWSYATDAIKVSELSSLIDESTEIINNNGEIAMIIVCCLGAFIVVITVVSSIHSLTKPATKPTKK